MYRRLSGGPISQYIDEEGEEWGVMPLPNILPPEDGKHWFTEEGWLFWGQWVFMKYPELVLQCSFHPGTIVYQDDNQIIVVEGH